ncbi:MAG: hypothetical protein R2832_14950 [Rhodothermales bacterium]
MNKPIDERHDVVLALPQRRNVDHDGGETIIEVLAEAAGDLDRKVSVGCGNNLARLLRTVDDPT